MRPLFSNCVLKGSVKTQIGQLQFSTKLQLLLVFSIWGTFSARGKGLLGTNFHKIKFHEIWEEYMAIGKLCMFFHKHGRPYIYIYMYIYTYIHVYRHECTCISTYPTNHPFAFSTFPPEMVRTWWKSSCEAARTMD